MTKTYALDLSAEVGGAFLAGALITLTADGVDLASLSLWQAAALSGGAAALVLAKGLVARLVGDRESTSLRH